MTPATASSRVDNIRHSLVGLKMPRALEMLDATLRRIEQGEIDPSFVITHEVGLDDGPEMYQTFRDKEDGCVKVVLKP